MKFLQFNTMVFWAVAMTIPLVVNGLSFSQEISVVSPNGLEDTEGSLRSESPTDGFRIQWLYPTSDFSSIPDGGAFIIGHAIRADGTQSFAATNTFADSIITLSTTSVNSLGPDFVGNMGGDATVVFDGSNSLSYPVSGPAGGPNPFGDRLQYQIPFFYDPSLGNLLVEQVTLSGNDIADTFKDWESTGQNTVAFNLNPASTTASDFDDSVIVTQFTFVPEPTSVVLVIMGLISLCLHRWQGRSRAE